MKNHFLSPGRIFITNKDRVKVTTILGSCVSVTVHNKFTKTGGIIHALLPADIHRRKEGSFSYLENAIPFLIKKTISEECPPHHLDVMLFGGGNVIRSLESGKGFDIGLQNIRKAHELLNIYNIKIKWNDTGGETGRKLIFYPYTGEAWRKFLKVNTQNIDKTLLNANYTEKVRKYTEIIQYPEEEYNE